MPRAVKRRAGGSDCADGAGRHDEPRRRRRSLARARGGGFGRRAGHDGGGPDAGVAAGAVTLARSHVPGASRAEDVRARLAASRDLTSASIWRRSTRWRAAIRKRKSSSSGRARIARRCAAVSTRPTVASAATSTTSTRASAFSSGREPVAPGDGSAGRLASARGGRAGACGGDGRSGPPAADVRRRAVGRGARHGQARRCPSTFAALWDVVHAPAGGPASRALSRSPRAPASPFSSACIVHWIARLHRAVRWRPFSRNFHNRKVG